MMSIVINHDEQICIASDRAFVGTPSGLEFCPGRRSLFLTFDDGRCENLGSAGIAGICQLLHRGGIVQFMQLRKPLRPNLMRLPLRVSLESEAIAV